MCVSRAHVMLFFMKFLRNTAFSKFTPQVSPDLFSLGKHLMKNCRKVHQKFINSLLFIILVAENGRTSCDLRADPAAALGSQPGAVRPIGFSALCGPPVDVDGVAPREAPIREARRELRAESARRRAGRAKPAAALEGR